MKSLFEIREYDNGALEIQCNGFVKTIYSNGDIIYYTVNGVFRVITHDGKVFKYRDVDTSHIDSVVLSKRTTEAILYSQKQNVIKNLNKNVHHYDDVMTALLAKNAGEPTKITESIVRRFFDIKEPSNNIKLSVKRSGAAGFDVHIYVNQNPSLQDAAMGMLDSLLTEGDGDRIIRPWSVAYDEGISYRYFSGDVKESQSIILKWFKNAENKFGKKNLTVYSLQQ